MWGTLSGPAVATLPWRSPARRLRIVHDQGIGLCILPMALSLGLLAVTADGADYEEPDQNYRNADSEWNAPPVSERQRMSHDSILPSGLRL
jgi:hypothetical protein